MDYSNFAKIINAVKQPISLVVLNMLLAVSTLILVLKNIDDTDSIVDISVISVFVLLMLVSVITLLLMFKDRKAKNEKMESRKIEEIIADLRDSGGETQIIEKIEDISNIVRSSFKFENHIFKSAILKKLIAFRGEINDWERGILYVGPNDSKGLLIEIYKNAKEEVFSTSAKDFSEQWDSEFGEKVIRTNSQNKEAPTLRVFIFNSRNDLTEKDFNIIRSISKKVSVRVYFDQDDDVHRFKPGFSRDFTIIDGGKIIGVTESFRFNKDLSSRWYFDDQKKAEEFELIKDSLLDNSLGLADFEEVWESLLKENELSSDSS